MGAWLDALYSDRSKFESAIKRVCLDRLRPGDFNPTVVNLAQTATCNELFVGINQLDYSIKAKHGCYSENNQLSVVPCDIHLTFFFGFFGMHSS